MPSAGSLGTDRKHQAVHTAWRSVHEYHVQLPTFPHLFVWFPLRDSRHTYFQQFGCTSIFLENPTVPSLYTPLPSSGRPKSYVSGYKWRSGFRRSSINLQRTSINHPIWIQSKKCNGTFMHHAKIAGRGLHAGHSNFIFSPLDF